MREALEGMTKEELRAKAKQRVDAAFDKGGDDFKELLNRIDGPVAQDVNITVQVQGSVLVEIQLECLRELLIRTLPSHEVDQEWDRFNQEVDKRCLELPEESAR